MLLDDVSFRVGEGAVVALVGAERRGQDDAAAASIAGDLTPHERIGRRAAAGSA